MRSWPILLCALLLCLIALVGVRTTGDGGEYLLQAHALGAHGTPALRVSDVDWLAAREPQLKRVCRSLRQGMAAGDLTPISSVRRSDGGEFYTIHFWLYALCALPFLWLSELLRLAPERALGLLNGLAASLAVLALWSHFGRGRQGLAAAVVFALCGTTFYIGWTGPEALTGAAVVCACVAARRGALGLGLLAGAVAAAQNASAAALLPYVAWSCWQRRAPVGRRDVALGAAGACVVLAPYTFFYAKFHVPSLVGHFATDPALISGERAWSLLFDLNQGMLIGLPGLLLGVVAATVLALRSATRSAQLAVGVDLGSTLLLITAMGVPTLAVHNWNSGNSVVIRYAYWLALPLLVLLLELTRSLPERSRWALLGAVGALQLAAIAPFGLWGERYSYVRHTWAAKLVLRHFPGAYNPVPEIFFERSLGWEAPPSASRAVVWPYRGTPGKLMADASLAPVSERICPDGSEVLSHAVHTASDGWLYLDAPFECRGAKP